MHISPECDVTCWSEDGVSLRSSWDENVIGMHISPECDVTCWSEDGISLRSSWDENVIGMDMWVVDNPMGSRMATELPEIFGWCSDIFNCYFLSPVSVFGWFGCDVWSVKCGVVWELSKGIVVRCSQVGQGCDG